MSEELSRKPPAPDLPKYLREALEKQSPERLETVVKYAQEFAEWKRQQRQEELEHRRSEEEVDEEHLEDLENQEVSTDPDDYEDVPASGSYITVKETKPGYYYYYFQWRDGDTWKNEYIAPVKRMS